MTGPFEWMLIGPGADSRFRTSDDIIIGPFLLSNDPGLYIYLSAAYSGASGLFTFVDGYGRANAYNIC